MNGNKSYALLALTAMLLIGSAGVALAQGGGSGLSPAAAVAPPPPAVELHGYIQNRLYEGPGANTTFRTERISLSAIGHLPENSTAYVEVYYHPWAPASGLYLESAYYDRPIDDLMVRIGKGRRIDFGMTPAYPNRKTSNYGIVSEAFTQDRIPGIQFYTNKRGMDMGIALMQGFRLGTRNAGEISGDAYRNTTHQVPHLSLRDVPGSDSQELQLDVKVGGTIAQGLTGAISAAFSKLDPADLAAITGTGTGLRPVNPLTGVAAVAPLVAPGTTKDTFNQYGAYLMKKWDSGWIAQGEWYKGKASTLDYDAWDVLGGYIFANGWKAFARYSQQNMDTPLTDNPLSWDINQTSLSVVQPISKSVWLQYEYEINGEKTNVGSNPVSNNLFFVELFSGF